MKIFSLFFSMISAILLCKIAHSQQTDQRGYTPPSPNAMNFMRYGEHPVDYSTGVPSIDIPLYTIDLGDYQFPISASFHASGRKVSLDFSPLGLNWSLNAYGMISREIRGKSDELSSYTDSMAMKAAYYLPRTPVTNYNRRESYERMLELAGERPNYSWLDGEYDIYTLSINGVHEQFIILPNKKVHFLSGTPYKVEIPNRNIFLVTDDKGVKYEFESAEQFNSNDGTSSWFVKQITTPTNKSITFTYNSVMSGSSNGMSGSYIYGDRMTIGDYYTLITGDYLVPDPTRYSSVLTPRYYNEVYEREYRMSYLTAIEFNLGKIVFNYNPSNVLLTSIDIRNLSGGLLKKVEFQTGNFLTSTNVATLPNNNSKTIAAIIFKNENNTQIEKFGFDYYKSAEEYSGYPTFCRAKDLWGYYNGRTSGNNGVNIIPINQIPRMENSLSMYTVGNKQRREVNFPSKITGMIKSIYYPTGGVSEFIYENNLYYQGGTLTNGPGIRIQKIISSEGNGTSTTKEYKYGSDENGAGALAWLPSDVDFYTLQYINSRIVNQRLDPNGNALRFDGDQYRWRVYSSEPVKSLQAAYRLPVYYSQVTEYTYSTDLSQNNGKVVYQYSSINDIEQVFEDLPSDNQAFRLVSFFSPGWAKPRLMNRTIYRRNNVTPSTYTRVSERTYEYSKYNERVFKQVWPYRFHRVGSGAMSQEEIFAASERPTILRGEVVYVMEYDLRSAVYKLDEERVVINETGNDVESKTTYRYDNPYYLESSSSLIKSDGSKEITLTTYPDDYASGTVFIDNMKTNHLIAYPIEQVRYKEVGTTRTILSGQITKYLAGGKGQVDQVLELEAPQPIALSSFKFSNRAAGQLPPAGNATAFAPHGSYRTALTYSNYDSYGNPQQMTPADGPPTVYLWGYLGQYPVAEIKNAMYSEVVTALGGTATANTVFANLNSATVAETYIRNTLGGLRSHATTKKSLTGIYTYKPLMGMGSATDPSGRTTYYSYDGFGRLQDVKNTQQHVTEGYRYNYRNQ